VRGGWTGAVPAGAVGKRVNNRNPKDFSEILVFSFSNTTKAKHKEAVFRRGEENAIRTALLVSHYLENEDINYIILSSCTPEVVQDLIEQRNNLYGRVLSIYDGLDEYAGSCRRIGFGGACCGVMEPYYNTYGYILIGETYEIHQREINQP
jgi:hypothetical protein